MNDIKEATMIILDYLTTHGKSTAEVLQDILAEELTIKPGTMNELYEHTMTELSDRVLIDFTGIQLLDKGE